MERDVGAKASVSGVFDRAASTYDEVAGAYHDHFGARLVESWASDQATSCSMSDAGGARS